REVFGPDLIDGIELGLSSDTQMGDQIKKLHDYTFDSDSDAHAQPKNGGEYQQSIMVAASIQEFYHALNKVKGKKISKNFGMNPQLGKYHTTVCSKCMKDLSLNDKICSNCGSKKIIKGVFDRIQELADVTGVTRERPPYIYQVPLEYLPK